MEWNAYLVAIRLASDAATVHIIERRYLEPTGDSYQYVNIKTCCGVELTTPFDEIPAGGYQLRNMRHKGREAAGIREEILVWMERKKGCQNLYWNGQAGRGMARESQVNIQDKERSGILSR